MTLTPRLLDHLKTQEDNGFMPNLSAIESLELLNSEAQSLHEEAKKYRDKLDVLDADDPRRESYELMIRDLLNRSNKIFGEVTSSAHRIKKS